MFRHHFDTFGFALSARIIAHAIYRTRPSKRPGPLDWELVKIRGGLLHGILKTVGGQSGGWSKWEVGQYTKGGL